MENRMTNNLRATMREYVTHLYQDGNSDFAPVDE